MSTGAKRSVHYRELGAAKTGCGLPGWRSITTCGPVGVTCRRCIRSLVEDGYEIIPPPDWQQLAARLAEALRETTGGLADLDRVNRWPSETPAQHAAVAELRRLVACGTDALAAYAAANSSKKLESSPRAPGGMPTGGGEG